MRKAAPESGQSLSVNDGTKLTEPGYKQLLNALSSVRRTSAAWPFWIATCRCDGSSHHARIEYKVGYYGDGEKVLLFMCARRTSLPDLCDQLGLDQQAVMHTNSELDAEISMRPRFIGELPTMTEVREWCRKLLDDDLAYSHLVRSRGLSRKVITDNLIGWDGGLYRIPVFDDSGALVNVRTYNRYATGDVPKIVGLPGRTAKQLYPSFPNDSWVLLCEGEWDALAARRRKLPSITTTGGVNTWNSEWNQLFLGVKVAIVYDCDESGRLESVRRAEELVGWASAVRIVDLGLGDGEDLTDWFVKHKRTRLDLLNLIRKTEAWRA